MLEAERACEKHFKTIKTEKSGIVILKDLHDTV